MLLKQLFEKLHGKIIMLIFVIIKTTTMVNKIISKFKERTGFNNSSVVYEASKKLKTLLDTLYPTEGVSALVKLENAEKIDFYLTHNVTCVMQEALSKELIENKESYYTITEYFGDVHKGVYMSIQRKLMSISEELNLPYIHKKLKFKKEYDFYGNRIYVCNNETADKEMLMLYSPEIEYFFHKKTIEKFVT